MQLIIQISSLYNFFVKIVVVLLKIYLIEIDESLFILGAHSH